MPEGITKPRFTDMGNIILRHMLQLVKLLINQIATKIIVLLTFSYFISIMYIDGILSFYTSCLMSKDNSIYKDYQFTISHISFIASKKYSSVYFVYHMDIGYKYPSLLFYFIIGIYHIICFVLYTINNIT